MIVPAESREDNRQILLAISIAPCLIGQLFRYDKIVEVNWISISADCPRADDIGKSHSLLDP